ncbi:MAG: VCBS repeat-containing protein, partial [Thermoplasmata archaeon]|nr:VCBS repeat-containing protein [Thermoplasmata archaeon]
MDMRDGSRRTFITLIIVFLMAASGLSGILGSADDEGAFVGGPGLFDTSPWVDDFNDMSRVNTTIGTEVIGGLVQLETGTSNGLVASVPITAPPGYRYDILILEIDTPGSSSVKVSVLNATEESTKVGYVNEPIPGLLKVDKIQVPLSGVSPKLFPQIRLQADLESAGTERPSLLKWTLHYVALDMWRDEFWGDGKVEESNRLIFDGDRVSVDLSVKSLFMTGYADHDPYPTLIANRYSGQNNRLEMGVFYTNTAGNDWTSRTQLYAENPRGFVAGDLDDDGYMDLVVANYRNDDDYDRDSWILWGDTTGTWDVDGRSNLSTSAGREPALGDVDGDGDLDILIANGGGSGSVRVWYNPGNRSYSSTHDVALPGSGVNGIAAVDLNDDGFEDVVLAENYDTGTGDASRAYFGSASGIHTTADRTYPTGDCQDVCLGDFNGDEWPDIAFANTLPVSGNDRAHVFFGSANGPDQQSDYQADVPDDLATIAAGDINGDGYDDFVIGRAMYYPRMYVFYGSASGPGNRDDPRISSSMYDNIIIDINGDGYDDVVSAVSYSGRLDIFHGSASGVDGTADDSMDTDTPRKIAVGVERRERSYLMGTLVSNVINRPMDKKWDILVLEADLPANTEMSVDILDTGLDPILGFTDLTGPDIDLSAVTIPGIHIQISLRSND